MSLLIKDLHVSINGVEILKGINLEIKKDQIHALMGPNGAGKSTLGNVLMGHPNYKIDSGSIMLDGKDITKLRPNERAKLGLFLSFQYPREITGVTISNFLRTALNAVKGTNIGVVEFYNLLKEKMARLNIDSSFSKRYVNEGFSGGEKKRAEILQLSVLEPKYAILDETDSGLDADALKIVANGINEMRNSERGFLLITHYYRILNIITPDTVSIIIDGKIVKTGGKELAHEIEDSGFAEFLEASL
ncbi:MAG: Fe-S cluster assembly ATPase SufC [Nanoarchaeota archaeon]